MTRRTRDPFPVQGRIRVRYQPITIDPLEAELARIEAEREAARAKIANGHAPDADPTDLRGIPCIARGVGGTSPGTDPYRALDRLDDPRRRPPLA